MIHSNRLLHLLPRYGQVCRAILLCFSILYGMTVGTILWADDPAGASEEQASQSEQTAMIQAGPRALSRAFRMSARKATPAVVTILTYGQDRTMPGQPSEFDREEDDEEESDDEPRTEVDDKKLTGIGSGVIVSPEGMVITNNHVITGAKRVVVQLSDETELETTDVRGDRKSDVATLRIIPLEGEGRKFAFAEIADSDTVEIGDWVLTIGSPFRLEATVSAGIISAKDRALPRIERGRLIQTDAAINPGNSGGPMVDLDGRVIAISTAIATRNGGYQGIGFAIPINQAKWIADELANHGRVRRAAIGTRIADLKPRIARAFDLEPNLGVLVHQIIEGSVAQQAGFEPYDVILEFGGERIRSSKNLQEAIERLPIGSVQEVKVLRKGEELMLKVELATVDDPTGSDEEPAESPDSDETDSDETDSDETDSDETDSDETGSDETGSDETGSEESGAEVTDSDKTSEQKRDTSFTDVENPADVENSTGDATGTDLDAEAGNSKVD